MISIGEYGQTIHHLVQVGTNTNWDKSGILVGQLKPMEPSGHGDLISLEN